MKTTLIKAGRYALMALTFLLITVSVSALIFGGALKFFLTDKNFYIKRIVNDKYVDRIYELSEEDVEKACGMYGFDPKALSGCIDKELISELSRSYISSLFDALENGGKLEEQRYPESYFSAAIELYAASAEENDLYKSEENRKALAENLADRVTKQINSYSDQPLTKQAYNFIFKNRLIKALTVMLIPALAVLILSAAAMIIFGPRPNIRYYLAALAAYLGALICFIPINKIHLYDLMPKLILVPNASKAFLDAAWNGVVDFLHRYVLIILIIFSLLLLVSVIMCLPYFKKSVPAENDADEKEKEKEKESENKPGSEDTNE